MTGDRNRGASCIGSELLASPLRVVEIVGVIAMFGFLNRWNDTFATPLEDEPMEFGEKHLAAQGWDAGKHVRS